MTRLLVSEAIDYFISAKEAEGRSPLTREDYSRKLTFFAKWSDDCDISTITVVKVRSYIAYLQGTGIRAVSVAGYIRPLKAMCRFLVREELLDNDPFRRVRVPAFEKKLHDLLSDQDLRALLAACDLSDHEGRRNYAIVCFLFDTGVRVGELTNLKHQDVDIRGRFARVFGKGSKERIVFFSAQTAMALTRYTSRTPAKYKADWLFTSLRRNIGGRLTENGVGQMLTRLGRSAGVTSRVNPHTFRHTFATNYLRAGGDLNSLMRLMGHADLTILQTYLSLATNDLRDKHEQFSPLAKVMGGRRR